jgi:predicted RNA-binding protein with PUA-like domain
LWEGVTSPAGVKNLREMTSGDKLLIYHSGKDKRVVGTAIVAAVDASDPKVPRVTIQAGKAISRPLTLAEIKASPRFKTSLLVRQSRLSVVPSPRRSISS